MANIITGFRIVCSIVLLCTPAFSDWFTISYLLAGFSDMIDGTVARMTNKVSDFGSKFDTVADFLFVCCCMIKLLPMLVIQKWMAAWILVIAGIKILNLYVGYRQNHRMSAVHSILNKVTGAVLFALPLTLKIVEITYSGTFVCMLATIAALQEGKLIRNDSKWR